MIGHDFPYLDTRDLNLDWLLNNMKQILADWATYQQTMNQNFADLQAAVDQFETDITTAFDNLHDFVDDYFDNLDVQQEINNKLNAMKLSGELAEIMNPLIATETATWLAAHITNPSNPPVDTSLSVTGAAADAKVTGDLIKEVDNTLMFTADYLSKVRFQTITPNMLDPLTYVNGYLSSIAGNITASDDWRTTDFLPIKDDTSSIYISLAYAAFRYIWYSAPNKESYIGTYHSETSMRATLTPPEGAKYIRVSYVVLDDTRDYSEQYLSYNDYYQPFGLLPLAEDIADLQDRMDQIIIKNAPNLLNPEDYTEGYLGSIQGNVTPSADWRTTDFLELTDPTASLYIHLGYPAFRYIFYTAKDKQYHVGDYGTETVADKTLTPPEGARFIRVSYAVPSGDYDYDHQYISNYPHYVPYGTDTYTAQDTIKDIIAETIKTEYPLASIKIVSPDGKADYISIAAAVDAASDGDVIYVLPGVYKEAVACGRKYLSIIGFSKHDCVLWNDYGDYDQCPLWMCAGYLKNMTIKAIQKQEDEGKTSDIPYCIHIDMRYPNDTSKRDFEIDNCDFISDWSDCLGCGTADNGNLIVRNCYFENTAKSFRYPFAYHNTTSSSQAAITLENNRLVNKGTGAYCIYLYDYSTAQSLVDVELIGNTCVSAVNGVSNNNFVLNATHHDMFTLTNTSHGNNIASMNYSA